MRVKHYGAILVSLMLMGAPSLEGKTLISGTDDEDEIRGTAGEDEIRGGWSNDIIWGLAGDDNLYGEWNDDEIYGGDGDDGLFGGDGHDELYGDAGEDRIYGGAGWDILNGGSGNDKLHGGYGYDTFVFDIRNFGEDSIDNFEDTKEKIDLRGSGLSYSDLTISYDRYRWIVDAGSGNQIEIYDWEKDFVINADDFLFGETTTVVPSLHIHWWTQVDEGDTAYLSGKLTGASASDVTFTWSTHDGSAEAGAEYVAVTKQPVTIPAGKLTAAITIQTLEDTVYEHKRYFSVILDEVVGATLGGVRAKVEIRDDEIRRLPKHQNIVSPATQYDDTLIGTNRHDLIKGEGGNDRIEGGLNLDELFGGDGHDRLYGQQGIDFLYGGTGNDRLEGGEGNDELHGETGDDTLHGGTGQDTLIGRAGADTLTGGSGHDTFRYDTATFGADTITDFEDQRDVLDFRTSGLRYTDLTISVSGSDKVIGVSPGNRITLTGRAATTIDAADFVFDAGVKTPPPSPLLPKISIGGASVTEGGLAQFTVSLDKPSESDVTVTWSTSDDTATAGADYTTVPTKQVTIPAGAQSQTVTVQTLEDNADEADIETFTVTLTNPNGATLDDATGTGTILDNDPATPRSAQAANVITGTERADTLAGTDAADTMYGLGGDNRLKGGDGHDILYSGPGKDRLFGQQGDDVLYSGAGKDRLRGGRGDDFLHGGAGADDLRGQMGDDILDGGDGDDTLRGGAGVDTFLINAGAGQDTITDFDIRRDFLIFIDVAFASVEEMLANYVEQQGENLVIFTETAGELTHSVTLEDFSLSEIGEYSAHFLIL